MKVKTLKVVLGAVAFAIGISVTGWQPAKADSAPSIKDYVAEFYQAIGSSVPKNHDDDYCPDDPIGSCVDTACSQMSSYNCDGRSEVFEVIRACRGNYSGGCVQAACSNLGSFGCDQPLEVLEVVRACRGNRGGACVRAVCERLGSFECDQRHEVVAIARECGQER